MREKELYQAINRLLPKSIHHQSLTYGSISYGGTPDRWYEGEYDDLWVEFKMLRHMPKDGIVRGDYSAKQLLWMERRYHRPRWKDEILMIGDVVGIVGLPDRTAVIQTTPKEWREGIGHAAAMSLKEVAEWIIDFCGVLSD